MNINALRADRVLTVLREEGPLSTPEIVARTGIPQWALNQSTGALLLLEAEGKVTRTGAKRWTVWRAT